MNTEETRNKVNAFIAKAVNSPAGRQMLEEALRAQDVHMFLGVSHMFNTPDPERMKRAKHFGVLDTETTGLEYQTDKIIQLSVLKVAYDKDGIIAITKDFLDMFNDPGIPIPPDVTRLTGITDEMVKGHRIDQDQVREFISNLDFIIAHNANFDRKFVEKGLPNAGFADLPWACSQEDVDWKVRGMMSTKLELILKTIGYVYPAHEAKADCAATAFALSQLIADQPPAFSEILESLRTPRYMILAENLDFKRKDILKKAELPWKWSEGPKDSAGAKAWYVIVRDADQAEKAGKAATEAYGAPVKLRTREIDAQNAYSERLPEAKSGNFATADPRALFEKSSVPEVSRDKGVQIRLEF